MPVLANGDVDHFWMEGYVLVSGLIPAGVVGEASATLLHLLSETETGEELLYREPRLTACYTAEVCAAAAELVGLDASTFQPPARAFAIPVLPVDSPWAFSQPHIDHAFEMYGHKVFPPPFRIAALVYLTDVSPQGGGTMVWPRSHTTLEQAARNEPVRYETMFRLRDDLDRFDLGQPVQLTPRSGDVLFYHYLLAHSGSSNCSGVPRLALNMKW